jgi:hypothetical protein
MAATMAMMTAAVMATEMTTTGEDGDNNRQGRQQRQGQ